MKRVRESPLGPDVTSFLRGVPDWQLLLEGSGIDPVSDLDRLLVATPNLQRSKLVLAGQHPPSETFVAQERQTTRAVARQGRALATALRGAHRALVQSRSHPADDRAPEHRITSASHAGKT